MEIKRIIAHEKQDKQTNIGVNMSFNSVQGKLMPSLDQIKINRYNKTPVNLLPQIKFNYLPKNNL